MIGDPTVNEELTTAKQGKGRQRTQCSYMQTESCKMHSLSDWRGDLYALAQDQFDMVNFGA